MVGRNTGTTAPGAAAKVLDSFGKSLLAAVLALSGLPVFAGKGNTLDWHEADLRDCSRRPITSMDLLSLREIGGDTGRGLSVSPDGRYFALEMHRADAASNSYRAAWFVSGTGEDSTSHNVGDAGDPDLFRSRLPDGRLIGGWSADYAKWSPDSRHLVYRKKRHGETQLWMSTREEVSARQLTHNPADVTGFWWSDDGRFLYFTTDADRSDLQEAAERRYRSGHVYDHDMDWSTVDGQPLYPPYLLTGGQPRVWRLDLDRNEERPATVDDLSEYERLAQTAVAGPTPDGARHSVYAEDGRGIAWVQADDPERQGESPPLTLYARKADGIAVRCPAAECTGVFDLQMPVRNGLHWSAVDDEVIFARKEGIGYSTRSLYGWHVGQDDVRKILSTTEWLSDCTVITQRAICFRENPVQPRTVVAIDLNGGSIETLLNPNPEFDCLALGEVELMEWRNQSGYGTFGYLVLPPDYEQGSRYPLVFVGYRARYAARGGVGNEYPVHLLAGNGFAVLVYDKPTTYVAEEVLSDPIDIGKARWGPDLFDVKMPLESFEAAVEILTERGIVDPGRVALTGLSNGSAHVNYAVINSDLFAAAIASTSDFGPNARVLVGTSGELARRYRKAIGAWSYPGAHGFLFPHMSLSVNANRVQTPLLLNLSDHEHVWALEEVVALIEAEKPVEMVVYPDEGHLKWQPAHRATVYERNVDWLRFWLMDDEAREGNKAQQYQRWHELRDGLPTAH